MHKAQGERAVFFTYLIRFILIWWLISVIYRWVIRSSSTKRDTGTSAGTEKKPDTVSGMPYSGDIEDADFEEIDNR